MKEREVLDEKTWRAIPCGRRRECCSQRLSYRLLWPHSYILFRHDYKFRTVKAFVGACDLHQSIPEAQAVGMEFAESQP